MKNLTVVNADFDQEIGFFWVEFNNGKSIQCCLIARKDGNGFTKKIDRNDNGSSWGVCGDTNEWAAIEGDYTEVNEMLHREARKLGIKIN